MDELTHCITITVTAEGRELSAVSMLGDGERDHWLDVCRAAMCAGGFSPVTVDKCIPPRE